VVLGERAVTTDAVSASRATGNVTELLARPADRPQAAPEDGRIEEDQAVCGL